MGRLAASGSGVATVEKQVWAYSLPTARHSHVVYRYGPRDLRLHVGLRCRHSLCSHCAARLDNNCYSGSGCFVFLMIVPCL